MIATKPEIKAFLAITSTTQDSLIDRLIPVIEDDIREYCHNDFRDGNVYMQSSDILFTRNTTSADTITYDGTGDGFTDSQFKDGQTVRVQGSYNNDGFFEVESVSSTTLTMYSTTSRPYFQEMVTEDEALYIVINKVKYPDALKFVVSQMANYKLKTYDYSVQSETVSRYSVTYNTLDMASGYPKAMMSGLNRWRKPVFV